MQVDELGLSMVYVETNETNFGWSQVWYLGNRLMRNHVSQAGWVRLLSILNAILSY